MRFLVHFPSCVTSECQNLRPKFKNRTPAFVANPFQVHFKDLGKNQARCELCRDKWFSESVTVATQAFLKKRQRRLFRRKFLLQRQFPYTVSAALTHSLECGSNPANMTESFPMINCVRWHAARLLVNRISSKSCYVDSE